MTTLIRQEDLIESVAAALQYISYYHPADYIAHLARAYEREQSPAAKDAMAANDAAGCAAALKKASDAAMAQ